MNNELNQGVSFTYGDFGLTAEQKKSLKESLSKSQMNETQKNDFLDAVSVAVDRFNKSTLFKDKAIVAMKKLKDFSFATHRMITTIKALNTDNQDAFRIFAMYFDECTHATNPAIDVSAEMREIKPRLNDLLKAIHKMSATLPDIEKVADYTIKQLDENLSNGKRQRDLVALRLAEGITKVYLDMFKELPPYTRATWFDDFMQALCETLKLDIKIGAKTLEKVHAKLDNYSCLKALPI